MMQPEKGQVVQIRFNNGIYFDAIVEVWSDHKSIVKLCNTNELVIIQKTLQDVMLVKIFSDQNNPVEKIKHKTEIQEEFEELKTQPKNVHNLSAMAKLKDELNKIEREETFTRVKSFEPTGVMEVTYGIPRNLQINRTSQHTDQETESTCFNFNSELQNLFTQKR